MSCEPVVLLTQEPGHGQLDQGGRVRMRRDRRAELDAGSRFLELMAIQHRTVAHRQHVAGDRLQLGR